LLRIISAKSAIFNVIPSRTAAIANIVIVVVPCCLILLSPLPLVISVYIFVLLWARFSAGELLLPSLSGRCELTDSAVLNYQDRDIQLIRMDGHFLYLCLILHGEKNQSYVLWRDSCDDRDYRQLSVLIKRRLSLREFSE
jgi:hypothetical protein